MRKARWITVWLIILGFFCGVAACLFGPRMFDALLGHDRVEEARVTSPDGQFDAVILREAYGGAAGGLDWYVCVVAKDSHPPSYLHSSFPKYVFWAGTLDGGRLRWREPHVLEIGFDKAEVFYFRNLWGQYEIANTGPASFMVEVRLVPSSDFSLLTPSGKFR